MAHQNYELGRARLKRKDEQKENRVEFDDALVSQHDVVRDEEGPLMKDEMMNERREWFTKELAQGSDFPEDLTGFYLMKNPLRFQQRQKIRCQKWFQ